MRPKIQFPAYIYERYEIIPFVLFSISQIIASPGIYDLCPAFLVVMG
ncbi:MAG: hypothetical protein NVS4B9_25890 [Ktedonobacteraceae bacterium]